MSYSNNYYRVLATLKDRKVNCLWFKDKRYYGLLEGHTVMVNPHSGEILSTICHECLHHIYPEFSEELIMIAEYHLVRRLTLKQAVEIISLFTKKARLNEREP
jgi:hypothetical protein